MSSLRELKEELNEATTLQFISETFTEVNALKIKKIRAAFEKNRRFYEDITRVYHTVKLNAGKKKLLDVKEQNKKSIITRANNNGGVAYVAITSNSHFYGALNLNVMRKFYQDTVDLTSGSLFVAGQTGVDYLNSMVKSLKYSTISFRKDSPTREELLDLLELTRGFDQVILYYPQFVTIVTQKVGVLDITQSTTLQDTDVENVAQFIFEPELVKIVEFFETQVRLILLTRAMLESDLSRASARLSSMSAAEQRAATAVKTKKSAINKSVMSTRNNQLLDTFAGLRRWAEKE
jgi:F-type H+-transporting ATPase subunit gamma